MKVLGNLNLCGNQIQGVGGLFDTDGNPIGQNQNQAPTGMAFKAYEEEFDSSDVDNSDSEELSNGDTAYFKYITIDGSTHGIANPIVQVFEVSNSVSKLVNVDIDIDDSTFDVTIKFASDENGNVEEWANDTINYKCRVLGIDASSLGSGSGSGSGY